MGKQNDETNLISKIFYWVIILFVIGLFVAIAIPNRIGRRKGPGWYSNVCINNLRQIDAAANEFVLEKGKTNGEPIKFPDDLTPYIKLNEYGKIPPCPSGGTYSIKKVGDKPICSLGTTVTPAHVLP
ncbi:MAG: hypothetical protein ABSG80_06030 [Verrucomicrobiota bacterium]|jgi:hypothetical protein